MLLTPSLTPNYDGVIGKTGNRIRVFQLSQLNQLSQLKSTGVRNTITYVFNVTELAVTISLPRV